MNFMRSSLFFCVQVIRKEALLDSARNGFVVSLRSGGKPIPNFRLIPGSFQIEDTEENRRLGKTNRLSNLV